MCPDKQIITVLMLENSYSGINVIVVVCAGCHISLN